MKKIFIILALALLLGGGGYYIVLVQPAQYGKGLVEAFRRVEEKEKALQEPSSPQQRPDDVSSVQKQKEVLEFVRKEISNLTPPLWGEYRQFHKDFLFLLEKQFTVVSLLEERVKIVAQLKDLYDLIVEPKQPPQFDPSKPLPQQMLAFWEEYLGTIQKDGREIFSQTPTFLSQNPSWEELKTAWQEADPALDVILAFFRQQSSNLWGGRGGASLTAEFGPREKEAEQKLEEFKKMLDDSVRNQRLDFSTLLTPQVWGISEEEFRALNERTQKTVEKIRQQYGEK